MNGLDTIDAVDRQIIERTQGGLPISPDPYHEIASSLGLDTGEVMRRLRRMCAQGIIRRIGAVPNHYALGYRANGMSVWDVADAEVAQLGQRVGALPFVSHCYRRPRRPPVWPYNLFAMVHGADSGEVAAKVAEIAGVLGGACRAHDVLYSSKILKKTGLRLAGQAGR